MRLYKCDEYIVASEEGKEKVIVEKEDEFFQLTKKQFEELFADFELSYIKELKENYWCMAFFILIILIAITWYLRKTSYLLADNNIGNAMVLLAVNIPLHEAGHIVCLKLCYPECRIKMGMKLTFIYPSFYVDTSYSYLLPKSKKICVHLAGGFMNSMFVIIILWKVPNLIPYLYLIISNILINFLPIAKTDGYYALASICNRFNRKKNKKSEFLEELIRGAILFAVLEILTILF